MVSLLLLCHSKVKCETHFFDDEVKRFKKRAPKLSFAVQMAKTFYLHGRIYSKENDSENES